MTCGYQVIGTSTYRCRLGDFNYTADTKIVSINGTHVAGGYSDNNVTVLFFPKQAFMEKFPQEILNKFKNAEFIQAVGITLKSIQPLESCSRLIDFLMPSALNFERLDKDAFKNCNNLETLDLNVGMGFVFPIGMNHTKLSDLSITGGNISGLTRNFFSSLKNLQSLDFSSNRITLVDPTTFTDLKLLDTLNLGRNQISDMPSNLFQGLKLNYLNLEDNKIIVLKSEVFSNLADLRRLSLASNQIKVIPSNTFNSLTKLTELNLDGNLLTKIDESFTKQLQGMANLAVVSLDNNKIANIATAQFSSMIKLNLRGNLIKEIGNDTFSSNNSKIMEILLFRNQITTIGSAAFKGLTKLVTLQFNDNKMTQLKREFFESLSTITVLDLSRNGVKTIEKGTFKAFYNKSVKIDLSGNNCVNASFLFPTTETLFDGYVKKCYVDDGTGTGGGSENVKIGIYSILLPLFVVILSFMK